MEAPGRKSLGGCGYGCHCRSWVDLLARCPIGARRSASLIFYFGVNNTSTIVPQPCALCLYTINSSTGAATLIGLPTYGSTRISLNTLVFAPDGTLYGTGQPFFQSTYQLYTLNPATALS